MARENTDMQRLFSYIIKLHTTALAVFLLLGQAATAEPLKIDAKLIEFSTLATEQQQFDELFWRGGLVLKSENKHFGGLSGIELSSDGSKLLAISDRGYWLKADIIQRNNRIFGLKNAQMSATLNTKGGRFKSWQLDSEGLTKRNDSLDDVIISEEHSQSIYRYKLGDKLTAPAHMWSAINDADIISRNRGIEGITSLPKSHKYRGWMLATAERALNKAGDHSAWLVNGKDNLPLYIKRSGGFDITDVAYLPNGDIIILERAIGIFFGPQMRIRQFCGADVKPNATLKGKTLLSANWAYAVDNMEGIAVHNAANGETILTIVSDNNFNFIQRNLLLQFALVDNQSICQ